LNGIGAFSLCSLVVEREGLDLSGHHDPGVDDARFMGFNAAELALLAAGMLMVALVAVLLP
jgi:hypothetical protein